MNDSTQKLLTSFDPALPLAQAQTIPSAWYHDTALYALERRAVFGKCWLAAGRAAVVAEPGSFLTTEIAGEPIVVVRDSAGVLRAFFNVCRHRAAPVVVQPEGRATKLRCRYHGWTYDLNGRLSGTPEFDGVADFCREHNGLAEINVAVWGPLVWVNLGRQPTPLAEFLAPLPNWIIGRRLESLRFVERRAYDLACNWKVYVDNFLDGGYHVNTIHPGLAGVLDYTQYRTEIAGNTAVQISPLLLPPHPHPSPSAGRGEPNGTVAAVRTGDEAAYWWVFPNFMLNLYQGVMDTNVVLPLGPDRCRVVFDFYFADITGESAEKFIRDSIAVAERIQQEDIEICEQVQHGLGSRSYDTGRFSVRREAAGYYFHQLLAARLRDEQSL